MRISSPLLLIAFLICAVPAYSQDATQQAIQASQQAARLSQQASQQALQASERASQQANTDAMRAMQMQTTNTVGTEYTSPPKFLLSPGSYPAGTLIRLRDRSSGAVIYYTTDGWTPTVHSTRYTRPITLKSDMTVQAIAVAKYHRPSLVIARHYKVRHKVGAAHFIAPTSTATPKPLSKSVTLPKGIPVKLAFRKAINSRTAQIGDLLPLVLAGNLVFRGYLIAPKGTHATGRVTAVNSNGALGKPGQITFHVTALNLPETKIPLIGQETKQGSIPIKTIRSLLWIPGVGLSSLAIHGKEAVIPSGALLTAHVAQATTITPEDATYAQPATTNTSE